MFSRRALLITGAASIAIIGTAGYRLLHSDLTIARQPWADAGQSFGDARLDALSYAVLAPNPHNRQPWLVRLDGEDAMTLFCDLDRLLPETDPPNRQITIGLGAFLELLRQAAAEGGYRLDITQFPEGEPQPVLDARPVAHIRFIHDTEVSRDPLFGLALTRRTVRAPFDQTRLVGHDVLTELGSVLRPNDGIFDWTNDPMDMGQIQSNSLDSWAIEIGTTRTHQESTRLMRIGESEINTNPDGISLAGPIMEGMRVAGIITRENLDDKQSTAYRETKKFYDDLINSSMAFGWLTTPSNSRTDQLNAGAGWIRIHLAATRAGLAMHPLSQALQEFPEMAEKFEEIHGLIGMVAPSTIADARIQGLFRFGYAPYPAPAPRWPLQTRLIADG